MSKSVNNLKKNARARAHTHTHIYVVQATQGRIGQTGAFLAEMYKNGYKQAKTRLHLRQFFWRCSNLVCTLKQNRIDNYGSNTKKKIKECHLKWLVHEHKNQNIRCATN